MASYTAVTIMSRLLPVPSPRKHTDQTSVTSPAAWLAGKKRVRLDTPWNCV